MVGVTISAVCGEARPTRNFSGQTVAGPDENPWSLRDAIDPAVGYHPRQESMVIYFHSGHIASRQPHSHRRRCMSRASASAHHRSDGESPREPQGSSLSSVRQGQCLSLKFAAIFFVQRGFAGSRLPTTLPIASRPQVHLPATHKQNLSSTGLASPRPGLPHHA
jgi:hypothetical protein